MLPETTHVAKPLRVSRYRNPTTRAHAFTTESESQQRLPSSFVREAVPESFNSSPFFYVYTEQYGSTVPIHRFRRKDGAMFFAATPDERRVLLSRGLEELDQPVFVYDRKVEGSSEVLRIVNPRDGDILYTTGTEEKDFYIKQGWVQVPSLGFAQSTSSSGTGILLDTTVKLEADDLLLVSRTLQRGRKIVFSATNSKIGALVLGTILYSEKSSVLPLGLVAKVAAISRTASGEVEVETRPAELSEAFAEFHLYLENQRVYFLPPESDSEVDGTPAPLPQRGRGSRSAGVLEHSADQSTAEGSSAQISASLGQPEEIRSAPAGGMLEPEYLGTVTASTITGLPNGAYWSQTLNFSQELYKSTVGNTTSALSVDGSLTLDATAELIYNGSNECVANPSIIFLLTPHENATLNVTASGTINGHDEKKILPTFPAGTFPVGGIPISLDLNFYAGYSVSGSVTARLTAAEDARMTAGVKYDLTSRQLSLISCPDPCPAGLNCGPTRVTGKTCALTSSVTGSFTADAQVSVYLKPELLLYAGAWGTGFGPSAYAKLQLKAAVEPPNLNLYAQLIPGVGAKIQVCYITFAQVQQDLDPVFSLPLRSFPLTGRSDPDVTSLAGRIVDVKCYYFQAPSKLWYIVSSSGNVLALKSVSNTFAGGILWKPISNYAYAYAGYPAAGSNYSSVQVSGSGKTVTFGSLSGGGGDPEVSSLANTTQQISWFYFTNPSEKWYIVSAYGSVVLKLAGVDPGVSGGILWKPINNYGANAGYPAAGTVYEYVYTYSDGKRVSFGPLN